MLLLVMIFPRSPFRFWLRFLSLYNCLNFSDFHLILTLSVTEYPPLPSNYFSLSKNFRNDSMAFKTQEAWKLPLFLPLPSFFHSAPMLNFIFFNMFSLSMFLRDFLFVNFNKFISKLKLTFILYIYILLRS